MKHQILIASYKRDFEWLRYCLLSLKKYSTGFLEPVIAVDIRDLMEAIALCEEIRYGHVVRFDGPGFGRAQAAMMSGDLLCPEADYIWLLGSDCLATRAFSPADYSDDNGRPIMLWNTWAHMEKHGREVLFWRQGVRDAIGGDCHGEFMRRLPIAYPKELFPFTRRAVVDKMHCIERVDDKDVDQAFNEIVFHRVNHQRNFSESNILGEIGYRHFEDRWTFVNIDTGCPPGPEGLPANVRAWPTALPIVQHWSHGGLDRPRDQDGKTPRDVIREALGPIQS